MSQWQELDQQYIMSTYNRLPLVVDRAEGNYLYDEAGKSYLDLFTGLAVNVLGHGHPTVAQALREQSEKFLHISNVFYNKPAIRLAQRLVEQSVGVGRVFFSNSGAESTEAAIKLVHKWVKSQDSDRDGMVVAKKSFHGRTLGAVRLTRQPGVYQDFPTPEFPVHEVEANDIEALREVLRRERPAAFLMEPVLGSGGLLPLEEQYLRDVKQLCEEEGVLMCMDEIQTGMGRTGKLFAYQHAGIEPDMILFAKGVGGGLPLGGVIVGAKLVDLFQPGDHGTTFGPSPLSAALGNAVLDVLFEEGQLEAGNRVADYLWSQLRELKAKHAGVVEDIIGKGMMVGIYTNRSAEEISQLQRDFLNDGILVDVTQKTVVRLLPPLTLTEQEVDRLVAELDAYMSRHFS